MTSILADPPSALRRAVKSPVAFVRGSVRGKLIAIVLLTTVTVLTIAGGAMLIHDLAVYRKSWAMDIASEAGVIALSSTPALAFDDPETAQRNIEALRTGSSVVAAGLYRDGQLYAGMEREGGPPLPLRKPALSEGLHVSGQILESMVRIEFKGEYLGDLYVRARYDAWSRVSVYVGIFSIVTALSFVAALMISAVMQQFITVPLEQMGEVARRIVDRHDYATRVSHLAGDEIGIVIRAFNSMLDTVQERTEALQRSNAALSDADRKKDEFLATLAHELRNPLAPIRHATTILDHSAADDARRRWAREVISRQVAHMALLLDDLLDVSRITRGKLGLKKEYVSLEQIINVAVETARPLIDAKHHTLTTLLPKVPVELNVDPLRMSQVVSNLLTNAAKYTDSGGRIHLCVTNESAGIAISVADSGIGLSASAISNVFEMFSQVESALERSQGGLGIGLALVKGLVELHGGGVEAQSDGPGRGSTFTVRLPNTAIVQHLLNHPHTDKVAGIPQSQHCKVLVVDDNEDAAVSLSMLLSVMGHEVITAHSGRQALELAAISPPDVCVIDIGMPGMNGYELAGEIRKTTWGRMALLVAATGWGQQDDKRQARSAGYDHHLTKPMHSGQLEALIAQFLLTRNSRLDRS